MDNIAFAIGATLVAAFTFWGVWPWVRNWWRSRECAYTYDIDDVDKLVELWRADETDLERGEWVKIQFTGGQGDEIDGAEFDRCFIDEFPEWIEFRDEEIEFNEWSYPDD